jgi:hypothetical protein
MGQNRISLIQRLQTDLTVDSFSIVRVLGDDEVLKTFLISRPLPCPNPNNDEQR